jgi:hypothetical protein
MKISPGRALKAGKGRAIPCYRKTDVRRQPATSSIRPEPFGGELRVELLMAEGSRVEFRGQNNVNVKHPRQLLHQSRIFLQGTGKGDCSSKK